MVISQLSGIQHLLYSSIGLMPIPEISPDSSDVKLFLKTLTYALVRKFGSIICSA